jgi:ribosome-associated protein
MPAARTRAKRLSTTEDFARAAVDHVSDKLGSDVVLLDLREVADITDFFVIASGETDRHLESMADELVRYIRTAGLHVRGREGTGKGGWILLDFPGFIVHLFLRPVREKYALEKLWARATEIVRIQ